MNKNRLKQLTFGFELEGNFCKSLVDLEGKFKDDGSVDSDLDASLEPIMIGSDESEDCSSCEGSGSYIEDCECDEDRLVCGQRLESHEHREECFETPCHNDNDYHRRDCEDCHGNGSFGGEGIEAAREYSSPKFTEFTDMIKMLKKFTPDKFVYNESCGFHLHIGLKNGQYKKLYNVMSDYNFLMSIYEQAKSWCPCLKDRLMFQDNLYYQTWKNERDLIKTFKGQFQERNFNGDSLKYRFMRFHEEFKTLEFRFLCPCEHKVANTGKLISLVTDYLNETTNLVVEQEIGTINPPQKETMNITLKSSTHKLSPRNRNGYEVIGNFSDLATSYEPWTSSGFGGLN